MTTPLYDIPLQTLAGAPTRLREFQGKVLLIVNVASKCGLTPQYQGLEELHERLRDQGLVVAGFPANDFAGQEPGTADEIQAFCTLNYAVEFPLFAKITVVGAQKHPLYRLLTTAQPVATALPGVSFREKLKGYGIAPNPEPEVLWNFEKFLVARDGRVVRRFSPDTEPGDPGLAAAINDELGRTAG